MTKPLNDTDQARRQIGISKSQMYRYIRDRKIASIKVGRRIKISQQAIDDFISANLRPAKS